MEGQVSPVKKQVDRSKIVGRPIEIVKGKLSVQNYLLLYSPDKNGVICIKNIEVILLIFLDKLYWVSDSKPPQNYKNAFFFNIDNDLTYFPFNKDFGPLNLAMVHRFSRELARLLKDKNYSDNLIFHYCTSDKADKMVNGAFLMGAFMIIIFKC